MVHQITSHFQNCIKHLKSSGKSSSYKQIALKLDMHPQCMSDILHSKREVTLKIMNDFINLYNCNPNYLHHGQEPMFLGMDDGDTGKNDSNYNPILYISGNAQSDYITSLSEENPLVEIPHFNIPDKVYNSGELKCFDVLEDSMEPTVYSNDKVICRKMDSSLWLQNIRPQFVYIFVTNHNVMIRRVQSVNKEAGIVTLVADNEYYEPTNLPIDQIKEVNTLMTRINHFRPIQNIESIEQIKELKMLKETVRQQSQLISQLNGSKIASKQPVAFEIHE